MSSSSDLALARLRADIDNLTTRLDELEPQVERGVRQRKWFFISLLCNSVAVGVALALIVYILAARGDSRAYYNEQLKMLVCSIPPGETARDELRAQADCPPYKRLGPARSSPPAPSRTPQPSATRTVTGEARLAPSSSSPPSLSQSRTPRAGGQPAPSRTVRVVTAPPQIRTLTTVRTASPTATVQPTTGLLPGLLCVVLGCKP